MGRRFVRLSAAGAVLTLNGLRPLPGSNPLAVPSFFSGWLTSELAPHNLAITVAGTSAYVARRSRRGGLSREDRVAVGLNLLSVAGLAWMIRQGMKSADDVEQALTSGLHDEHVARLDPAPTKADLATPGPNGLIAAAVKGGAVR